MRILINRKPVEGPWGGGNLFVKSMCKFLPAMGHEIVHEFDENIDLIFLQDPRYSDLGISINEIVSYKKFKPETKIIHRVNECDPRKGTNDMDDLLRACSNYTDATVFVSNWIREYYEALGWSCPGMYVVYNGVDSDVFKPVKKHDNGRTNIVTHHWSNNFLKGFDIYDMLDEFVGDNDDFSFTYIGREMGSFKNTKIVDPLHGEALGNELGKYDVYVSASRFDPGPNHILESLSCGIPTYVHEDGGGAVEFAGSQHSYKSFEQLKSTLLSKDYRANASIELHGWKKCVEQYNNVITTLDG